MSAHPDDEASKSGAFLHHLARRGFDTTVIALTGGEAGRIQSRRLDHPANHRSFTDIRNEEQGHAGFRLGLQQILRAGYGDGGMRNDPARHDHGLHAHREAVVALIEHELESDPPAFVVTHPNEDEQAAYDHPDHAFALEATLEAVGRYNAKVARHQQIPVYLVTLREPRDAHLTFSLSYDNRLAQIEALGAYESQVPSGDDGARALRQTPADAQFVVSPVVPVRQRETLTVDVPQSRVANPSGLSLGLLRG